MKPTVLVTGGAGYIGSHCCKRLAGAGYTPVVYDDLSTGHRDFVRWGPLVEGDIRDRAHLEVVLGAHRPVAVMHLAALALVGESVRAPARYQAVNVAGTRALLEAMQATGTDRLVFSSSCAVYGTPAKVPIDEAAPKAPVSPYGATKLAAESSIDAFGGAHGIRSVSLRYFNACGADPAGEIGEDHDPETHLIPLVLDVALGRRPEIAVFGTDYPTEDGTAVRDYVHVGDIAAAHLAAVRYLDAGGASIAVNLGTGSGASVAEVIGMAELVTGRPIATRAAPRREGDPARLVASAARAESELGWRAKRPDLETAIGDAWAWHQARFGGGQAGDSGIGKHAQTL